MDNQLTLEKLGLTDPKILQLAIAQDRELFFALAMAQELKQRNLFPIQDIRGFDPVFADNGGVLRTPGVLVYQAEGALIPPAFFPITDEEDFIRKVALVVRSVHKDRTEKHRVEFDRRAPRDAQGQIIRYKAISGKQKGGRHG